MAITQVTSNVIKDDTIKPDKLSTGGFTWNSSGNLSAVAYVGDGSRLTGVTNNVNPTTIIRAITGNNIPGTITAKGFIGDGLRLTGTVPNLSVLEVTDTSFFVEPIHNHCVVLLNSLSTINVDIGFSPLFVPGHKTYFIQTNTGRGKLVTPEIYNVNNFFETYKQYAVCELEYLGLGRGWTLYGDLTSTSLAIAPFPTTPLTGTFFTQVFAGGVVNGYALSGDDLYGTGNNQHGRLGLGDTINRSTFTKVVSAQNGALIFRNPKFTYIGATGSSLALSGTDLYSCGYNTQGELGLNDTNNRSIFTKVTFPTNAKWVDVASGNGASYALLSGGDLYVCGSNNQYQIAGAGIPATAGNRNRSTFTKVVSAKLSYEGTTINDPKFNSITCNNAYGAFALSGNDLYACGYSIQGQLGLGFIFEISHWTRVNTAMGGSDFGSPYLTNTKWTSASLGFLHALALSGTDLYATGANESGQLGIGNTTNKEIFTKVVSAVDGSTVIINPKWTAIAAGKYCNFAISGTDIYAAGWNSDGQLGFNDAGTRRSLFTKILFPTNAKWTTISVSNGAGGGNHTYALSGTILYSTGNNTYGELGLGDNTQRLTFTQVTAVAIPQ